MNGAAGKFYHPPYHRSVSTIVVGTLFLCVVFFSSVLHNRSYTLHNYTKKYKQRQANVNVWCYYYLFLYLIIVFYVVNRYNIGIFALKWLIYRLHNNYTRSRFYYTASRIYYTADIFYYIAEPNLLHRTTQRLHRKWL